MKIELTPKLNESGSQILTQEKENNGSDNSDCKVSPKKIKSPMKSPKGIFIYYKCLNITILQSCTFLML